MKKVLLGFLAIMMTLFIACGKTDYEYKDGLMYENRNPATGTFEFKSGDYKVKGQFVNGTPEGIIERYYLDGSLMIKDVYENGKNIKEEIYYKNGSLMGVADIEGLKIYYNDGHLVLLMDYNNGQSILYHENGNPMMIVLNQDVAIYNENDEILFKVASGRAMDLGLTMKKLKDGSFEILKGNKLISTLNANGDITNYLYSTGEKMITLNEVIDLTEFFFKDGTTLMKQDKDDKILLNYKNGKPLYQAEGNNWNIYDEEGNKISGGYDVITDIKKLN